MCNGILRIRGRNAFFKMSSAGNGLMGSGKWVAGLVCSKHDFPLLSAHFVD